MLFVVSQYIAPSTKASPSLFTDGSDDLAPRNRSSNRSYEAAAAAAASVAVMAAAAAVEASAEAPALVVTAPVTLNVR